MGHVAVAVAVALVVVVCGPVVGSFSWASMAWSAVLRAVEAVGRLTGGFGAYLRSGVLVVDEVGCLPLERAGAGLVFLVFSEREGKGLIVLASNRTFSGCGRVFGGEVLATAVLDGFLRHCGVISMNGCRLPVEEPLSGGRVERRRGRTSRVVSGGRACDQLLITCWKVSEDSPFLISRVIMPVVLIDAGIVDDRAVRVPAVVGLVGFLPGGASGARLPRR
ncbi:ATP-binding protein [Streptomyces sp. NRRL F-2664]|uniref:ATP-binding protein n=1 Tax=Streptomyces sp. NRRL F-2664 TaxID=1463842 RepID=UPI003B638A3D